MRQNLLSVLILSRERQFFLKRQIEYWKFYTNINVIIIDQSIFKLNTFIEHSHIKYIHTSLDFQDRVVLASDLLNTKYVIFLPDDEFLIPTCLDNCVKFLEKNDDYISCAGRSLEFEYVNHAVNYNLIYQNLENFNISNTDSLERIFELSNPYKFQPIHSVCNSLIWKEVALIFKKLNQMPPETFELIYGFVAAYHGKLKVISELMNLRSKENEPINDLNWNQKYLIKDFLFFKKNFTSIKFFFNSFSENFDSNFSTEILYGIYSYVYFQDKSIKNHNSIIFKNNIFYQIKNMFQLFRKREQKIKIDEIQYQIKLKNIALDTNQLNKIDSLIKMFHKNIN